MEGGHAQGFLEATRQLRLHPSAALEGSPSDLATLIVWSYRVDTAITDIQT